MKEITPTQKFYNNFRLYAPDKKCKECGQIVKSKNPDTKFYLIGITESGLLKVKQSNIKIINSYHPDFFIIEPPKEKIVNHKCQECGEFVVWGKLCVPCERLKNKP